MARGKTPDNSFVSSFIALCVSKGKPSPAQVCEEASSRIKEIDDRLAAVQELKKERSNLMDVLGLFGGVAQEKQAKNEMKSYAVGNLDENFAQELCSVIENGDDESASLDELIEILGEENRQKIYHTVKELAKMRVLSRNEDKDLIMGDNWSQFVKNEED